MNCPVCRVELMMADRQGVEIDYCPQCRGVWLDRGELDKIVEQSKQTLSDHLDPDYRGHGYSKHKRKSFLRDIFDFD